MKTTSNVRTINPKSTAAPMPPIVKIDLTKRVIDSTLEELGAVVFDSSLLALEQFKLGEQPAPDFLTGAQMAAKLGVSRSKLHALRLDGCPAIRVGTTYKFDPIAVTAWVRAEGSR